MTRFFIIAIMMLVQPSWANEALKVDDVVVREMLPGMKITSGYFNLTNQSTKPIKLASVSSSVFERVEIHQHVMEDGMMDMQQVTDAITIAPEKTIEFKPGGYHLMLFNPKQKVAKKSQVDLKLNFVEQGTVKTNATVMSVLEHQKQRDETHHH